MPAIVIIEIETTSQPISSQTARPCEARRFKGLHSSASELTSSDVAVSATSAGESFTYSSISPVAVEARPRALRGAVYVANRTGVSLGMSQSRSTLRYYPRCRRARHQFVATVNYEPVTLSAQNDERACRCELCAFCLISMRFYARLLKMPSRTGFLCRAISTSYLYNRGRRGCVPAIDLQRRFPLEIR